MAENLKKLLIVEDDPGLQKQLKWAYEDFEVIVAGDRETAINLLRSEEPVCRLTQMVQPKVSPQWMRY